MLLKAEEQRQTLVNSLRNVLRAQLSFWATSTESFWYSSLSGPIRITHAALHFDWTLWFINKVMFINCEIDLRLGSAIKLSKARGSSESSVDIIEADDIWRLTNFFRKIFKLAGYWIIFECFMEQNQ